MCLRPSRPWKGESGCMLMAWMAGLCSLSRRVVPMKVPLVPRPATKWVTCPAVCARFRAGRVVVGQPVGVVRVLIDVAEALRVVAGQFAGAANGAVGALIRIGPLHGCAIGPHDPLAFRRDVGRAWRDGRGSRAPRRAWPGRCRCCRCWRRAGSCRAQAGRARCASRTMAAAARSLTLPPGLAHSALASRVMPWRPRTTWSSRRRAWSRCVRAGMSRVRFVQSCLHCGIAGLPGVCEIGERGRFRTPFIYIRRQENRRWPENPEFRTSIRRLKSLRAHSFDVAPSAKVAGGRAGEQAWGGGGAGSRRRRRARRRLLRFTPECWCGAKWRDLLDRGYQKFIKTSQFELPASASQLHAIHLFCEELKQLTGGTSLYNESLGTTSDVYEYDRLQGPGRRGACARSPLGADRGH